MLQRITFAALLFTVLVLPTITPAQSRGTEPQRGQKKAAAKPTPLTLRQVVESLSALRNSKRVEDQILKTGVQFQATPDVVDILKQFGASAKLISMIPAPRPSPPPPAPPKPKIAGPLTVVCEPNDCIVVVNDKFEGATDQKRKIVSGVQAGDTDVQVFADGFERLSRRIKTEEGKPTELKFELMRSMVGRQQSANASLLKVVSTLGGSDGLAELGDVEGSATAQWKTSGGSLEQWTMTFNKRIGKDLAVTFKTSKGQCMTSIVAQTAKQECKGDLKGREKVAEQGTSLFLSYQLQDVINALLKRPMTASEKDENRVESIAAEDSYFVTIGKDGLITDLVYRIGNEETPIHVRYSDYLNLKKGRYPGRISVGRLNSDPVWVFTLNSVRGRFVREK